MSDFNLFKADPVSFSMLDVSAKTYCRVCGSSKSKLGFWVKTNGKYHCSEECEYVTFPHLKAKREANRKDPDRFKGITSNDGFVKMPKHDGKPGFQAFKNRQRELNNYVIKHGPSVEV